MVLKVPKLTLGQFLVLGGLVALAVYQYLQVRSLEGYISRSQEDLRVQMQSFNRDLGRAQTSFASSHEALRKLVRGIPVTIRQDLDRMNAEIASVARFRISASSSSTGRVKPVPAISAPDPGPLSCNWSFSDWRMEGEYSGGCGDGDFTYVLNQSYEGLLLEAKAPQGSAHYLKVWELGPEGGRMEPPLTLNDFTVVKKLESEDAWQVPAIHLDLGIGVDLRPSGEASVSPHVGISFLGHGKTKDDLNWRLIKATVSPSEEAVGIGACPFSYNVGKKLPLFSNIWLSPCYLYRDGHSASLQLSGVL